LLRTHLENGLPPVVFVNTDLLSYWSEKTGHAVVVVAIEQDRVYVNDPKFADAPKVIPLVEFESAWIEQYQEYAVIGLDQISPVSDEVDT
jgi:ABC-type bacteriocin/lantibiotic exporter with double-glycine peptidase domain